MIPDEVSKTIRLAVTLYRNISDSAMSLGYDDDEIAKFQEAVEDSDRALDWLDALPQTPQPDWSQAPEWAMWWAVNADGWQRYYEREPYILDYRGWEWWDVYRSQDADRVDIPIGIDWRTLKVRRPEVTE